MNVSVAAVAIVDGCSLSGRNAGMLYERSSQLQLNLKAPLPDIICSSSTFRIRIDCVLPIRTEINNHTSFIHSFSIPEIRQVDVEHIIKIIIGTVKTSHDNKIQIIL